MVSRRSVRQAVPSGAGHRGTTLARRRSEESVSGRSRSTVAKFGPTWDRTPDGARRGRARLRRDGAPDRVVLGRHRRRARAGRGRGSCTRSGCGRTARSPAGSPPGRRRSSARTSPPTRTCRSTTGHRTTTRARPSAAPSSIYDDATRTEVWDRFVDAPAPVGYDPAIIPVWTSPTADTFAALKLTPWRASASCPARS